MLEKISDLIPFDYIELLKYLKQFPSVTFTSQGYRANFYAHTRDKARNPVRDLDGRQMRILLESLGIKVYVRNTEPSEGSAAGLNWRFNCKNYVEEAPEDSLLIIFSVSNFFAGPNGPQYPWMKDILESGRPYLWVYNDVRMDPTNKPFLRHFPQIAESKTIGMMDGSTFHVNYNVGLLKSTDVQPSVQKFCYIGGNRPDLKKRLRCFKPNNTLCYGMIDKYISFDSDIVRKAELKERLPKVIQKAYEYTVIDKKSEAEAITLAKDAFNWTSKDDADAIRLNLIDPNISFLDNDSIFSNPSEDDNNSFWFQHEVSPNEIVDKYSRCYATVFTTSANSVLGNITPRLYETLCSNAVVFFDVKSDLVDFIDMPLAGYSSDWEFRKVSDADDADNKLKILIDNPDLRKQLVDNQHKYIEMLDKHVNSGI